MPPLEIIRTLILVISCLVEVEIPEVHRVVFNGQLDLDALRQVEIILRRRQRRDILAILRETMNNNFQLLRENESNIHEIFRRFRNDPNPGDNYPRWCYRLTHDNNPVRQETGQTVGRNVVPAIDTERTEHVQRTQIDNRDVEDQGHSSPHISSRPERHERKSPFPLLSQDGFPRLHSPFTDPQRVEVEAPQCCICGKNIQGMRSSQTAWQAITNILRNLPSQQIVAFLKEVINYDRNIFHDTNFHDISYIVTSLKNCHLRGGKCVLCLLNYAFQRIGRIDLADRVRLIRSELR